MGPPELIIVGIIAIAVIFGAKKLPEIAHNLGRSSNEFKKGLKEGADEADAPAQPTQAAPPPVQPTQAATPTETTEQPKPEA
jgi:sec-independent protein translocase protein TatA